MTDDVDDNRNDYIGELIKHKMSRRVFVGGVAAAAIGAATGGYYLFGSSAGKKAPALISPSTRILISWGESLSGAEQFGRPNITLDQQLASFGYNNDYIAFMPLSETNALLGINHENADGMDLKREMDKDTVDIMLAAMGISVIEIKKDANGWNLVRGSKYNRRINAYNTEIEISGPAGSGVMIGTLGNCAGGKTPWKTFLSCEENIEKFFTGHREEHEGMGIGDGKFGEFNTRFNVDKNGDEPYKFGWVVEYDPQDPASRPKKRTALGRFKHESANCVMAKDGRVVVYMGDDEEFQHLYKFVTKNPYVEGWSNRDMLDEGTLYAAKFHESGKLTWLPIPPERLLHTREAAADAGATRMDRPEDVEINHVNGHVYVACSKNLKRTSTEPGSPTPLNAFGHILELKQKDHADLESEWEVFMLGNKEFGCPDNLVFDKLGRMFVTTDGMAADGLFFVENKKVQRVLTVPPGAEFTGPEFSDDYANMFLSVQHPSSPMIPHVMTFAAYNPPPEKIKKP